MAGILKGKEKEAIRKCMRWYKRRFAHIRLRARALGEDITIYEVKIEQEILEFYQKSAEN